MPGKAAKVVITEIQQKVLQQFADSRGTPAGLAQRCQIILQAFDGLNNEQIASNVHLGHDQVGLWRRRWQDRWESLVQIECTEGMLGLKKAIVELLSDVKRSGRPPRITSEQQAQLTAKACEDPKDSGRPISHWTSDELADEMKKLDSPFVIGARWVRDILAGLSIRPHKHQYWLFSKDKKKDPLFDLKVQQVCSVYLEAIDLYESDGVHTICIDEKTGIQALERIAPDLLVRPGQLTRLEYEYIRHGTIGLFGNLHVATGKLWCPLLRETRTEEDMVENVNNIICFGGEKSRYRLVMDNLNTHCSESMVRMIAEEIGFDEDLGKKSLRGILKSAASRKEFLTRQHHRITCVFTPRHCSWLNQIEMWFGTLGRKLINRGSFCSVDYLQEQIVSFIDYYNENLAHPYNWTYSGKILAT